MQPDLAPQPINTNGVADPDKFHFGFLGLDPFHDTNPDQPKSRHIHTKINQNHKKILFKKIYFTHINNEINHF